MLSIRRLAFILLSLSPLAMSISSAADAAFKRVNEGSEAPSFTLQGLDGSPVNLKEYHQGPLTVVAFWALQNGNSAALLKDVQRLVDEFGSKGVRALGVQVPDGNGGVKNTPPDLDAKGKDFVEKLGIKFPMAVDRNLEQYDAWGVIALPATAFIGKDMRVIYEFSGHPTSAYTDMRAQVMEVLGIREQEIQASKLKREPYRPVSKSVALNYGLAKTLFERGQFDQAASKVEKVLAEDPKFPDAFALSGAVSLGLEQLGKQESSAKAREAFTKAVELDPRIPLGLAGLAHFAVKDGDLPRALEFAKKALEFTDSPESKTREPGRREGSPNEGVVDEAAPKQRERPQMKEGMPNLREGAPKTPAAEPKEATVEAPPAPVATVDVPATLADAEKALGANDAKAAGEALDRAVSALLAIPQGPKLKKNGLVDRVRKQP